MSNKIFDDYQNQLNEWQKKFFETWLSSVSSSASPKTPDLGKGIEAQEEVVSQYLQAQETAIKLSLETQKKFWEGYFELMRKTGK